MKKFLLGILGVTLVFGLMLAGCEGGTAEPLSSDATLKSITVNGVAATLGTPAETWDAAVAGVVELPADKLADAKVQVAAVGEGAIVYYKAGKFGEIPDFVADSTFTFDYGDCLYIEVFSANHDKVLIYQVEIAGSDAQLTGLMVGGVAATLGESGTNVNDLPSSVGEVYLSERTLESAAIVPTLSDDTLKVIYGKGLEGVTPDQFSETAPGSFAGEDYLYIGVSLSPVSSNYRYYRIVLHSTTPTITDVTLGGRSASGGAQLSGIPIPQFGNGVGKPGNAWNDTAIEEGEVWYGTSQESTSLALTVTKKVDSTTYQIGVGDGTSEPTFADAENIIPVNGQYLYVKTTGIGEHAENGYYKIKLTAKDDSRALTSVTINGESMTIGQLGTHSFPGSEAYGNYSNGAELATTGNRSTYTAASLSALNTVTVVATAASAKATVTYGHATDERSYLIDFGADGSLGKLKADEYIALEVTSELGEKGWYKFHAPLSSIASVSVGSVTNVIPGKYAVRNGTFGVNVTGTPTMILVPPGEFDTAIDLSITKATGFENAVIEYGVAGYGLPSTWTATAPTITDGITVMIRVTDTANIGGAPSYEGFQYFGIVVAKDGPPSINTLGIGAEFNWNTYGYDPLIVVPNLGTPNAKVGSVVAGSVTVKPAQIASAMPILGTAGSGITVTFAKTTGATPDDADYSETVAPNFSSIFVHSPLYTFADGDVIWVKAVRGEYTNYYKIKVIVADVPGSLLGSMLIQGDFDFMSFGYGYTATADLGKPSTTLAGITTPGTVTLETAKVQSNVTGLYTNGTAGTDDTVSVARTTGAEPGDEDWQAIVFMTEPPHYVFATNDILWVKVVNAEEQTTYYKIVVTVE